MRRPEGAETVVSSPGGRVCVCALLRARKGLRGFSLAFAGEGGGDLREGVSPDLLASVGRPGVGALAVNPELRAPSRSPSRLRSLGLSETDAFA